MNAYVSQQDMARHTSRISHPEHVADARSRHTNPVAAMVSAVKTYFARQSTLSELHGLSDRELADIGLHRAELRAVFDPVFADRRQR